MLRFAFFFFFFRSGNVIVMAIHVCDDIIHKFVCLSSKFMMRMHMNFLIIWSAVLYLRL